VMELVCHTAGEGGAGEGWRTFMSGVMDITMKDDGSSDGRSRRSLKRNLSTIVPKPAHNQRPVSKLRPKPPLTFSDGASILEVSELMSSKRADAVLLVNARGELSGILTDNDLTRRVISKFVDIDAGVRGVMTRKPKCVMSEDPALDALEMMVNNRFRHLPVLDKSGAVVGLLDIAKCLNEAISALEKVQTQDGDSAVSADALAGLMTGALQNASGGRGTNDAQVAVMQAMMRKVFGGSMPTLKSYLEGKKIVKVRPSINVREACCVMSKSRSGLLVMDDEELMGIFTPREVLKRIVSRGKSPDITAVSSVMITNPHSVSPNLTLLEALQEMFEQKVSYLVVEDAEGMVLGLVDVMEMVCHTAGGEQGSGKGWRDFFDNAMNVEEDNFSEVASTNSEDRAPTSLTVTPHGKHAHVARDTDNFSDVFSIGLMTEVPPHVMSVSNLSAAGNHDTASVMASKDFFFKVVDSKENCHRIQCKSDSVATVRDDVAKLLSVDSSSVILKYTDEDDDEVIITTDESMRAAIDYCRSCKKNSLKLNVTIREGSSPAKTDVREGVYAPPPLPTFSPTVSKKSESIVNKPTPTDLMPSLNDENSVSTVRGQQDEEDHTTKFIVVGGVVAALAAIGFIFARRQNN
jgi:CBS domain-containing protein